jgi:pyruvate formate lyase activating enzyme
MGLRVGLRKTSLVDYPGRVAAVLFFPACNLRCPWCHNRELVLPPGQGTRESGLVDLEEAAAIIESRRKLLGGVVLTGGEPLLRVELPAITARFVAAGIPVKVDTNGTLPDALERLLEDATTRPDYIALDLKLSPRRYIELARSNAGFDGGDRFADELAAAIERSAAILASSGIAHEFRSLAFSDAFFSESDLAALAPLVDDSPWYFAPFRPGNCLDANWNALSPASIEDARRLAALAVSYGKKGDVRSA